MEANTLATVRFTYLGAAEALYPEPPSYATAESVGIDLRACPLPEHLDEQGFARIAPGCRLAIPTGLAIEPLPHASGHFAAFVYSRSGLGAVQGLTVAQGVGVIDPDYRGEITVVLLNTSATEQSVRPGDRIAQLVFQPIVRVRMEAVRSLGQTTRGAGGFGHTGSL